MSQILRKHWQETADKLGIGSEHSHALFAEIKKRHSEKHRRYHGLRHLEALLETLEPFWADIQEPIRVKLAIWFHDIIYNPLGKDNEGKSADLMRERLSGAEIDPGLIDRVDRLIRATAHHRTGGVDHDDNLFLDADFSILGTPPEIYDAYTNSVRKEYWMIPGIVFKHSRKEFLRSALANERVFLTDEFEEKYGDQARENMTRELKSFG